jgi:zinc/manganese transport system permease protein
MRRRTDMTADILSSPSLSWNLVDDVSALLRYHFMQNALLAGTIVAVMGGLMGYFVVLRGQTFAAHTLSQIGFPGAAGAALAGVSPLYGLLLFCAGGAFGIAALSAPLDEGRRAESAAIGTILTVALALGFLFASLYHGFIGGVYAFLFGTFVGIDDRQVLTLLLTAVAALAVLAVIGRPLLFASVEPDVAAARGVRVRRLSVVFLLLLGLSVAAAAQVTGTLLVFALLVTPAATAQQLTARPGLALLLSVVIALVVVWVGMGIAYFSVYPVGFFVTSVAFAGYLLARAWRWARPRLARSLSGVRAARLPA